MNSKIKSKFIQSIRQFFEHRDFVEIMAPPIVPHPGMEPHIHPLAVYSHISPDKKYGYLHTSPEFTMKKMLSLGEKKIYNLSYSFRDEPCSPHHRPQFLMLEWYRADSFYDRIERDCKDLIHFLDPATEDSRWTTKTVRELFVEMLDVDILQYLQASQLKDLIQQKFPSLINSKKDLSWEDYYHLLFLNHIEPQLKRYPFLIVKEYPAPLAALATYKSSDPRVCQRFELYIKGIEIANCFDELINLDEQKKRWREFEKTQQNLYDYQLGEPTELFESLERGMAPSSGIALGVERLLGVLRNIESPFDL